MGWSCWRCARFPPTCRRCCCRLGGTADARAMGMATHTAGIARLGALPMSPPWAWQRTPLELPDTPPGVGGADPPCLVHLVRERNGLRWFRAFAEALRAHPPGVAYELVLAMKGFSSRAQAA